MSMWRGKLDRKLGRLLVLGEAVAVAVGLGSLGCEPAAPNIAYTGTMFAQRLQPGAIKIHRVSMPDEFYKDIGNVQITCEGQAQKKGADGEVEQGGSGGCRVGTALELARQHAAAVGAHGLHSIRTTPGASGNVVALNATAFRYMGGSEYVPGVPSAAQPLAPVVAVPPPPAPLLALAQAPAGEATADAAPAETAEQGGTETPGARPTPGRRATAAGKPETEYPPMRLAGNPPRAVPAAAKPAAMAASEETTAGGSEKPGEVERPAQGSAPPPAAPLPGIPPAAAGSPAASTLLPVEDRLRILKELKTSGRIPAQLYERRRKEILQGK